MVRTLSMNSARNATSARPDSAGPRFVWSRSALYAVVSLMAAGTMSLAGAEKGWYPHEGGLLKYRVNIRFGQEPETMPPGWHFGRVSAVATDANGEVYVFHRGKQADPLVVFDAKGRYLRSWGRGAFRNPHGLRVDREGHVWTVDNGNHTVRKWTRKGEMLLSLGVENESGDDDRHFYRPTDIAFASDGGFYVSDGYGNSRVVKFSAEGKFLHAWGKKGTGPGEFNTPHSIAVDKQGTVYVSDRENNRIQIFDANGKLLRMWTHLGATQNLFMTPAGELWIITHRNNIENLTYDTLAGRIMKVDPATGRILGSMESPGHWIHMSAAGEIFIGSLTGNVFRWYPGWLERGLGVDEGIREP